MIVCGQQKFKYYMTRKNIQLRKNQKDIWRKDTISEETVENYNKFMIRQQRKKANLLMRNDE